MAATEEVEKKSPGVISSVAQETSHALFLYANAAPYSYE